MDRRKLFKRRSFRTFLPLVQLLLELGLLLLLRVGLPLGFLDSSLAAVSADGPSAFPQEGLNDLNAALALLAKTFAGLVTHLGKNNFV